MDHDSVVALVAAIVRGTRSLLKATWVGQYELFDDVAGRQSPDHEVPRP